MHLTIIRQKRFPDSVGVFGRILLNEQPFCFCVENGDKLMPLGNYTLVPHDSPKHPNTLAFVAPELGVFHSPQDIPEGNTKSRSDILLHPANWADQLEGCCAPGESIARFPDRGMGVTNSRRTMNTLLEVLNGRSGHTAEVIEGWEV